MSSVTSTIESPPREMGHCELYSRTISYEDPFETVIPAIHEGPAVRFVDNVTYADNPGWIVRRNEDLRKIYADTEHFHKRGNLQFASMIGEDWSVIPNELDPPRHTAFRAALNPVFSPARMSQLNSLVRERARSFISRFEAKGSCEFIRDFAIPFPVTIFLDLIGLPQQDIGQFLEWERTLLFSKDMEARITSVRAVKQLLEDTIEDRKKRPGDDLISQTLQLEVDGRKWTDDEVFGHCFNLFIGGLDTVSSSMSLHFYHLATNPSNQEIMRNNRPEKNVVALEELLRAYAAVSTLRICSKEYEVGGCVIRPGDFVAMSTSIAGRDPETFEAPNEVRLDRKPMHVSFGHSIHRCLGQHLARRELQIAIEEFISRIPSFRVEPGYKVPFFRGIVLHVPELPLTWG